MSATKLVPNLYDKTDYVLHYRNLQQYLSLGMKLVKINKVSSLQTGTMVETLYRFQHHQKKDGQKQLRKGLL